MKYILTLFLLYMVPARADYIDIYDNPNDNKTYVIIYINDQNQKATLIVPKKDFNYQAVDEWIFNIVEKEN